MLCKFIPAALLALPMLGAGAMAAEGDAPDADPSVAMIEQIANFNMPQPALNTARIVQNGSDNAADLRQGGPGVSDAGLFQDGGANRLSSFQQATTRNQPGASYLGQQAGFGNLATSRQVGRSLLAIQQQFGDRNSADLFQNGRNNNARLLQDGDDNTAEQRQVGNNLSSTIIQTNDNNSAVSTQIGNNLAPVVIIQNGGMAVSVTVQGGF